MNTLKITIIMILLAGFSGCAPYLYSVHIPVAAYKFAQDLKTDDSVPELPDSAVMVADAGRNIGAATAGDSAAAVTPAGGNDTVRWFDDMRVATRHFRDLLAAEGVENPEDYVLTRQDKGDEDDFVLIAAVYRPSRLIEVADENPPGVRKVLTENSPAYYHAYRTDYTGRSLDSVRAWAVFPAGCFKYSAQQETVLKSTAIAVKAKTIQEDFWIARQQWNRGNVTALILAGHLQSCPAPDSVEG